MNIYYFIYYGCGQLQHFNKHLFPSSFVILGVAQAIMYLKIFHIANKG